LVIDAVFLVARIERFVADAVMLVAWIKRFVALLLHLGCLLVAVLLPLRCPEIGYNKNKQCRIWKDTT